MKNYKLNIQERIVASIIYFFIILGIGYYLDNGWDFLINSSNHFNTLFVASALMLIMGSYITEPYFTKPVDVIAKTFSILLVLFGISEINNFLFYKAFLYFNVALLAISIALIFIQQLDKWEKLQKIIYYIITAIAKPEIIFSILYLLTLFSFYLKSPINELIILFGLWFVLIFKQPIEKLSIWIFKIIKIIRRKQEMLMPIGQAISYENPNLYTIEVDYKNNQEQKLNKGELVAIENENLYLIGIVINEKPLLNKRWFNIYLLKDNKDNFITINLKTNTDKSSIFYSPNLVYKVELSKLNEKEQERIKTNYLYKKRFKVIGYVSKNSNIDKIQFHLINNVFERQISEGTIVETNIFEKKVLYQIVNGITTEELLENKNNYGFINVIAKKIGYYDKNDEELKSVKWLPQIYSPIFLLEDEEIVEYNEQHFIGKLPNTNYGVSIKDYNSLITHNTAILGILGIGKSRLTFELIQKVVNNTNVKVICIDITNQYKDKNDGLPMYINDSLIDADTENAFNSINNKFEYIHSENNIKNPDKSGNLEDYRKELKKDLCNFLFDNDKIPENKTINGSKKIRIYNPDYHKVSKGEKIGYNVITTDLTHAEKTRIITEEIFKILMKLPLSNTQEAKILLVFEEAHSLIPEWNSTANPGDQSATNGTAKIILQGRKYGLGSFIITQRTANISKSILNQCNTIFALRVFDDTGKQFLENYIGSDYASVLPTLEERHCVAVGKALKLKQPIILTLNDMKKIIKSN